MYTEEYNHGIYIEKQIRRPTFVMTYEHTHEYIEIFYLKSGACYYSVNGNEFHLLAGELFIVPPGVSHCTRYEGPVNCERVLISINPALVPDSFAASHKDILEDISRSSKIVLSKSGRVKVDEYIDLMLRENASPDEYSAEMLVLQTMLLLLTFKRKGVFVYETLSAKSGIPYDIEQAMHHIAMNYAGTITLEETADLVGLSPTYLSKKFSRVTGRSFAEYINYIRLRQAAQKLLTTDDNITKISYDCGFNSSNYFKDCFKKTYKLSPREYRISMKQYYASGEVPAEPIKEPHEQRTV